MAKYSKEQQEKAKATLMRHDWTKEKLVIVIKSVSQSGMSRRMDVHTSKDHCWISHPVAVMLGNSVNDKGIRVDGCGMNMAFWLADALTGALFGKDGPAGLKGNGGSCIEWIVL